MWAVAAQHKKYNDSLSGYNSLKDPHLNSYFRRPQIRRHLLRANIINKENKIVDEISSTKHLQRIERKQKKELYHLLEELVKRNEQLEGTGVRPKWLGSQSGSSGGKALEPMASQEELIKQAKAMFDGRNGGERAVRGKGGQWPVVSGEHSSAILLRLDRMIRAIREHEHITALEHDPLGLHRNQVIKHNHVNGNASDWKLWSSKSFQDIANRANSPSLKSYSSSGHLSRESRPKSSYGRTNRFLATSYPELARPDDDTNEAVEATMKKSKSCANIVSCDDENKDINGAEEEEEIDSVDGDSWTDSGPESDNGYSGSCSLSKEFNEPIKGKYHAYEKKMVKSCTRQRVKMTLRYNGLNGATNRGAKRNVKVFQQVAMGGNSILIYDGYIVAGDIFSFDIRPHPNNSFAIIILVNGIRDLRLNTCCEHKHRPGTRLAPSLTIIDVVGGRPCFACQNVTLDHEKDDAKKHFEWFAIKAFEHRDLLVEPEQKTSLDNEKDTETQFNNTKEKIEKEIVFDDEADSFNSVNKPSLPMEGNVVVPEVESSKHLEVAENTVAKLEESQITMHKLADTTENDEEEIEEDATAIELIEEEDLDSDSDPKPIEIELTETMREETPALSGNESDHSEEEHSKGEEEEVEESSTPDSSSSSSLVSGLTVITNEFTEDDTEKLIDSKDYITEETLPEMEHLDSDSDSEGAGSSPAPTLPIANVPST